jgi:signal transduction histidine kinase
MRFVPRSELALLLLALLIALPVAILTYSALHLLRDDRSEAERQARDNARARVPAMARQLAQEAGAELSRHLDPQYQGRIVGGRVSLLYDYPPVPIPADWPRSLTAAQARLWKAAERATWRHDAASARRALTALASSATGAALRSNVDFGLLELADWSAQRDVLIARACDLADRLPQEETPSGTPVSALALLLAMRHAPAGQLPERLIRSIESNTVYHPSFLTPEILDAARLPALQQLWQQREDAAGQARQVLRGLLGRPLPRERPAEFWISSGDQAYLALTAPQPGGWEVILLPRKFLMDSLQAAFWRAGTLPGYAGAVLEIAGGRRRFPRDDGRGVEYPVLASADGALRVGSASHPVTLRLDLANPAPLYAQYAQRRRLIEGAIVSAAVTALIGLVTLWVNHRRQARLAEMKSNFVSSVSHELRAPLAAVRLMAESLESGRASNPERQREYYRLIVQECRRLSGMVENVLDFARIDQGRQSYRFEPVDATALVRHTVMVMQPNADQRGIRLVIVDPPDSPSLQPTWDGPAVEQSLVNLLDNAIQHSPEGGEVRIEMETCGNALRLWVRDRGPGIPRSDHARIFDRFYRRGQELRRETKGAGIGLSIVKHVAEGHGGRVLVESEVGSGSSFALELPLHAGAVS